MKNHIAITLTYDAQSMGLKIPDQVTADRVVALLTESLKAQAFDLPANWSFKIKGKASNAQQGLSLAAMGLVEGDALEVIDLGEKE